MKRLIDTLRPGYIWWPMVAGMIVIVFTIVTPPFQGPDEVGHFWRAYSLARGVFLPAMNHGKPTAYVPRGVRGIVAALWVGTAGKRGAEAKVGLVRIRAAVEVPLDYGDLVEVTFPAQFTPIPYIPQALACFIGDTLRLRPLLTFYLGRLLNAGCALLLMTIALRLTPDPWLFAAVGMLPMFLYLCGTHSPDAVTDGLAFLVTALALSVDTSGHNHRRWWSFLACSLLLTLCKPAYFLIPFLAFVRLTDRRVTRCLILAVIVVTGVWIASAPVQRNFFAMRRDVPIAPVAQALNVRLAPAHFLRIAATDYRANWYAYLDQFVGHLGWLDIQLPHRLVDSVLLFLLFIGLTTRPIVFRERLTILGIVTCSLLLISLSQYLAWTVIGGQILEGMQGRYFLPLGPLMLLLISLTDRFPRTAVAARAAFVMVTVALNVVAITTIVRRYY